MKYYLKRICYVYFRCTWNKSLLYEMRNNKLITEKKKVKRGAQKNNLKSWQKQHIAKTRRVFKIE